MAVDFKNLRSCGDIELAARIEIEATNKTGFEDGKIWTTSVNVRTLHSDQSGFERS